MKNPWKLISSFPGFRKKDFIGKAEADGWEKALGKNRRITVNKPNSSRWWIENDDSKYYNTDELEQGDTPNNVSQNTKTGEAEGVDEARVESTAIDTISYDPKKQILGIKYKGEETIYEYPNVPEAEFKNLMNAKSKGKYMANFIAPKYSTNRRK